MCVIEGPKIRVAGHLGTCSGSSMIGLNTTEPCPVSRIIDLMTTFRDVNKEWLKRVDAKAKAGTMRLGRVRQGENGRLFLKMTIEEWFCSSCELTLTDAFDMSTGYLEEDKHEDGCMSLFHSGLTLAGRRDLHCSVPGIGTIRLPNEPGTWYLGTLTGPEHQVFHRPCSMHDLVNVPGLGYRSVSIMMRIGLFAKGALVNRKMNGNTTTLAFMKSLANCFVAALQEPGLRLPTFEEVLVVHKARVGDKFTAGVPAALATAGIGPRLGGQGMPKRRRLRGKHTMTCVD